MTVRPRSDWLDEVEAMCIIVAFRVVGFSCPSPLSAMDEERQLMVE